jgi:hypothetical protein
MAKINKNIIIEGLSGSLGGQLVIQYGKGGMTIVRTRPRPSNKPPTEAQLEARARFQEAAAYAKDSKDEAAYIEQAEGTSQSSYNVAIADWYHSPEVVEIDMTGWSGDVGEVLRAKVRDDVSVEQVIFVIAEADGTLVESGPAVHEQGLWWQYTTTADHPGGQATVLVTAEDIPGHQGSLDAEKEVT